MKNIFTTHYYDSSKLLHSNQLEGFELAVFSRRFFALLTDLCVLVIILYITGTILDHFGLISFGLAIGISSDNISGSIPAIDNGTHFDLPEYLKIILKLMKS